MSIQSQLKQDLDRLAARGARHLRRWALKQAVEAAWPKMWAYTLAVPALALLVNLAGLFSTQVGWPFGPLATLALTLAVPITLFILRVLVHFSSHRIDRRMSLALFDRALGYKDRLQAADEFIGSTSPDGFEQAAILDAAQYAREAAQATLPDPEISGPSLSTQRWQYGLISLVLLLAAFWLGGQVWTPSDRAEMAQNESASGNAVQPFSPESQADDADRERPQPEQTDRLDAAPRLAKNESRGDTDQARMDAVLNPSSARMSSGSPGSRPQNSKKSQSSSSESGASGKSGDEQKKKEEELKAKPRDNKPKTDKEAKKDEEKQSSGVSGGKGGSSGSKSSASDQAGADNRAAQEQDEDDSEGDPEDEEDEEQKAGSSSKPMLNQKKAPVNRSLSPSGLGEGQENPQANGRSGPGGLKKTRGVAAMLLGTPLPDRLKGQPNPGRVKVQRERAQPEEQFAGPATAGERTSRDEPIGRIARPELTPWMRDLVRNYFLAGRQDTTDIQTNTDEETAP